MKRLTSLFIALMLWTAGAYAQVAPVYAGMFQNILDSVCAKNNIKGASVAIHIPDMGTWIGAYGESHQGVPITSDMYVPIGSNTKTFVSCIMLKLQEQGVLSLDDTIGTWLQGIQNVSGQITIRQMLNHTSGLYNYTMHDDFFKALNADYTRIFTPEEMLQYIDTPYFSPGSKWDYSNTNYLLAGLIIKKVRNEDFHTTVRDMILTPLGLGHTITFPAEQPNGPEAHGWSDAASGKLEDMQADYGWTNNAFLSMAGAAGGMMSTAEDNVKFWNALMSGKVINANSLQEMKTFVAMSLGPYRGYGLALAQATSNSRRVYAHRGTCFGYLNENLVDSASGVCITILTNHDDYRGNDWLWSSLIRPLHKITINLPPAAVADVAYDNAINVYPNPATNYVNVDLQVFTPGTQLSLSDITGKVLMSREVKGTHTTLSTSDLKSGMYLLDVHDKAGHRAIKRILVTK